MNEYKASNGVFVRPLPDELRFSTYGAGNWRDFETAVWEHLRAKHDEDLGRWRWPENPDYVAYGLPDDVFGRRRVQIFNERTGERTDFNPVVATGQSDKHRAARAYFDAHPEPRPWLDAKPGEVWVITTSEDSGEERPYIVTDWGTFDEQTFEHSINSEAITAGRRIWPEVS